jgi:cobalamin-dependent methionine synthase I
VQDCIDLRALLRDWGVDEKLSRSHPSELEEELAERLAREIVKRIDDLIARGMIAER